MTNLLDRFDRWLTRKLARAFRPVVDAWNYIVQDNFYKTLVVLLVWWMIILLLIMRS